MKHILFTFILISSLVGCTTNRTIIKEAPPSSQVIVPVPEKEVIINR
ncbi:hypothetical protein Trichorick_01772 (plasmid) [Candidatus Trichorickettsia mobilis]|nr:hypothetical protein [Candidatus Trichorickettsia mobilis]WPY01849.1 hypothetical protein Trichorick_01772 [Candidatus Trichorickettsia mobilis]